MRPFYNCWEFEDFCVQLIDALSFGILFFVRPVTIVFLAEWFVFSPDNPAVAAILLILSLPILCFILPDVVI